MYVCISIKLLDQLDIYMSICIYIYKSIKQYMFIHLQ